MYDSLSGFRGGYETLYHGKITVLPTELALRAMPERLI